MKFSAGPSDQELLDLWLENALPEHDGGEATPARALRAVYGAGQEQVLDLLTADGHGVSFRYEDLKAFIRKLDKYEMLRSYWLEGPVGQNEFYREGFPDRLAQLGDLFSDEAEKKMRSLLT